jgi:undecaprenyl-diphosphatase
MLKYILLGGVQGVAEWLPVSSSGLLVLAQTQLFKQASLAGMIKIALFLHLGTLVAALIYFQKEISDLFKPKKSEFREFLVISTLISGGLGYLLLQALTNFELKIELTGKIITALVGLFLVITGLLQLKTDGNGDRDFNELNHFDAVVFGLAQGLAVLPGFSRSGLTVAVLLLRQVEKVTALKVSFIAGLPIIFAGNILLNIDKFSFNNSYLIGMLVAFVFGVLTIHGLLKFAKRVNLGYFVTAFGLVTIAAGII